MSLNKPAIRTLVKAALQENFGSTSDTNAAMDNIAEAVADAVESGIVWALQNATITHVIVLASPSGPVTGTITTTITPIVVP